MDQLETVLWNRNGNMAGTIAWKSIAHAEAIRLLTR